MGRSYSWFGNAEVRCPYYQGGTDHEVRCEGVREACITIVGFRSRDERRAHMAALCTTFAFDKCPIARAVTEKYEEADPQ